MALSFAEFQSILRQDQEKLKERHAPEGVLQCAACKIPLQESITGSRPIDDGTQHLCSDCYFEEWGAEIDKHPIITPRRVRGG